MADLIWSVVGVVHINIPIVFRSCVKQSVACNGGQFLKPERSIILNNTPSKYEMRSDKTSRQRGWRCGRIFT